MSASTYAFVVVPLAIVTVIVLAILWARHSALSLDLDRRPEGPQGSSPSPDRLAVGATAAPPYEAITRQA